MWMDREARLRAAAAIMFGETNWEDEDAGMISAGSLLVHYCGVVGQRLVGFVLGMRL
jgi:hypothetical protein